MIIPRSTRMRERIPLPLEIEVDCQESAWHHWTQLTQMVDVSQRGAGIILKRPTEPGRLLKLSIPLPPQLRSFDYSEPQYVVWSIVRYTSMDFDGHVESSNDFRVGVAFVGKNPPSSLAMDPATRFDALPPETEDVSMWTITDERPGGGLKDERRRDTRYVIPFEISIETFNERGKPDAQEFTVTERISRRGASVRTNLLVDVGRFVRISSERERLAMFAAVRSRNSGTDGITRIGLEFLNGLWPLDGA